MSNTQQVVTTIPLRTMFLSRREQQELAERVEQMVDPLHTEVEERNLTEEMPGSGRRMVRAKVQLVIEEVE